MNPTAIGGAALAFALVAGWAIWERHEAELAREAAVLAERRAELAAADAARWQDAAAERQGVIDRQASTLRRLESDGQAARAIAEANAGKAEQRIAALEARISKMKEAAHARPEDVRLLGPIVRDALPGLHH